MDLLFSFAILFHFPAHVTNQIKTAVRPMAKHLENHLCIASGEIFCMIVSKLIRNVCNLIEIKCTTTMSAELDSGGKN
jgi:uncharacterized membrane protein YesL